MFCIFPDIFNLVLHAALLTAVSFAHGHLLAYVVCFALSIIPLLCLARWLFLLLVDDEAVYSFFGNVHFLFSVWLICM